MDAGEISRKLADQAQAVCGYLFPAGVVRGREFEVGGLDGAAGGSLKVQLTGPDAGRWADFADGGGRGQAHGDLIDLWRMRKGVSVGEALAEIKAYLGVAEPSFTRPKEQKVYARPTPPKDAARAKRGTRVEAYLRGERGLTTETIAAFGVAEAPVRIGRKDDGSESRFNGPWILFPYLRREAGKVVTVNIKWLHLERRDGKKITLQEKNAQPGLFGWHLVPDDARYVVITEGEIDAMTVHQWGYTALSVPEGAGGGKKLDWIEQDWERLEQFETIYLCYDQDSVGQATIEEAAVRLGRHRCRWVKLPEKDANDCLIKRGMTAHEFVECIESTAAGGAARRRRRTARSTPIALEEGRPAMAWCCPDRALAHIALAVHHGQALADHRGT